MMSHSRRNDFSYLVRHEDASRTEGGSICNGTSSVDNVSRETSSNIICTYNNFFNLAYSNR